MRPDEFETYATKFDELICKTGSHTVLFATGRGNKYYPRGFIALDDPQIAFGKKHGILVAAAGYAWLKYLGANPTKTGRLDLYDKDGAPPGAKGTYLNACLVYSVLTGKSPEGLTNGFPKIHGGLVIPEAQAARMQKIAWSQYAEK